LDSFGSTLGDAELWSDIVSETINWLLNDPTWQDSAHYRGGKLLDDAVDTMICLATSLSYAHRTAHVWQNPQCTADGHIIGPGLSNDGMWVPACSDKKS